MKRNSLGWWLAAINVLIVVLVAAGVSWFAIDLLERLADSQERARVQLAGADARAELTRASEDALTFARVLAERPTLRRLLAEQDLANLQPFLQRFCGTANMDACAVLQGDQLLGAAGADVPWNELTAAIREQGERFLVAPRAAPSAFLGATSAIPEFAAGARVIVAHQLNDRFAQRLGQQSGSTIRFRDYRAFNSAPEDAYTPLHTAALADGRFAVARLGKLGSYASSYPVFSSTGEGIVLIESRISSEQTDREVRALKWRLLTIAAVLGVLALLAGVLLGRRITRPAEALTDAALRLGQGDFATSIPTGGPAEIGQLARTMDDMRRNLIELTGTLRKRDAESQAVLGGIVEGVYAVDRERRIRYLNPQAAKLLGIAAEDAIGRFCGDVLKPHCVDDDLPCDTSCPILAARQRGQAEAVENLQTPAGDRRMVLVSARPVDDLQVQVIRDETELEGVRRARDTVLANISHEFRTPLAAQLASIELLREGLATRTPAQNEELVISLERSTLRLTRPIDNLLESVRIESGQLDVRQQSLDLTDVIDDATGLVDALLRQRSQHIQRDLQGDLSLNGDALRLTQVFVNLLANASKFAPESTTIRVGARRDAGRIIAWVEDAGPGLPEGTQKSLFERFERGGVEPAPGGMGLGLAISRSIVQRHGGSIGFSRTADGYTRFELNLPAVPQA
jgi:signal transduction histidine kinase